MTRDELKAALVESDNHVYAVLRKITDTGTKYYDFYSLYVNESGIPQIRRITHTVADIANAIYCKRNECIRTRGDADEIVYNLAWKLVTKLNCEVLR